MKQTDYNEIAKIIKTMILSSWDVIYNVDKSTEMINNLADYFEKDTECSRCIWEKELHKKHGCDAYFPKFNRKQFLKDCGVEDA